MENLNNISSKLLIISNNQREIEQKLEMLEEKRNQIDQILLKQYILEKEVAGKIIQYLIKKASTISSEIGEINKTTRTQLTELMEIIYVGSKRGGNKRKIDDLCHNSISSNIKKKRNNIIQTKLVDSTITDGHAGMTPKHTKTNLENYRYSIDLQSSKLSKTNVKSNNKIINSFCLLIFF